MRVMIVGCLALVIAAAPVLAKEKKSNHAVDSQAAMETYKKLAMPGEQHQVLASLAGSWTTRTKSWMEPGKPPTESTGSCEEKMLVDGRFLQQECTGEMMGHPFTGVGLTGYDNYTKKYTSTWMDSMGTGIFVMEGTGSSDGKTVKLAGSHKDPIEGLMKHHAVWKIVDANTQVFELWGTGKHSNGKDMKMMEITYNRKQG
jgi:hypothetical protein